MRFRIFSLKRFSTRKEERNAHVGQAARRAPADDEGHRTAGRGIRERGLLRAERPAGVSEVTRDRVRRVAEQLGWRPSTAARALSGEGAATVGFVLARPAHTLGVDSFFLQLVSGIQEVLARRHLGLLFQVAEDVEEECGVYRRWWAEHRVDGVLVVDPRTDDPRPDLLDGLGLPAVVIGGAPDERHPGLSTVWADDAGAMTALVDGLFARGHRRIAHIAGLPGLAHTERRIRALRAEAERRGLTEVQSVTTDYSDAEGAAVTRRVLEAPTPRPPWSTTTT